MNRPEMGLRIVIGRYQEDATGLQAHAKPIEQEGSIYQNQTKAL